MKVWVVELRTLTTFDEWTPQSYGTEIENIFDSKDKAGSYVKNSIKRAITKQKKKPDQSVEDIIDHVPTTEEIFDELGCWFKTEYDTDFSYHICEYDVK